MHPRRVYIEVCATFDENGDMRPLHLKWEDGLIYEIDKLIDVRRAASAAGSMGIRYTVKIMGQLRHLFYEDIYSETGKPRWFVESA